MVASEVNLSFLFCSGVFVVPCSVRSVSRSREIIYFPLRSFANTTLPFWHTHSLHTQDTAVSLFPFHPQASCATGRLTTTPAGRTDFPTPPSACPVRGTCRGTTKVGLRRRRHRHHRCTGITDECAACAPSSARRGVPGLRRQRALGDGAEHQRVRLHRPQPGEERRRRSVYLRDRCCRMR